jgi:hypothetical protein
MINLFSLPLAFYALKIINEFIIIVDTVKIQ